MRVVLPSPRPSPSRRGRKMKSPAHLRRRRAGLKRTLLWLADLQDFNIIRAAWRFHFDTLADLMVQDGFTNRRLVRDLAVTGICLCRTNNNERLRIEVTLFNSHFGADLDGVAFLSTIFVDDFGSRKQHLQFLDASFHKRLLVLGGFV